MTYQEKLKDHRWLCVRDRIIERDKHECKDCGQGDALQVHHCIYQGADPWDTKDEYLITLCDSCHYNRHSLMKEVHHAIDVLTSKMNIWHWWSATREMREDMIRRMDGGQAAADAHASLMAHIKDVLSRRSA